MQNVILKHIKVIVPGGAKQWHTEVWRNNEIYAIFERRLPNNIKHVTINCYRWPVAGWKTKEEIG